MSGSADIGPSFSYSSVTNGANQQSSDFHNYSTSNNLNRDDTSPLGGPSTSEEINIGTCSTEEQHHGYEIQSVQQRINQLNLQSHSYELQQSNRISRLSNSNTTTSGSISLRDDSSIKNTNEIGQKKPVIQNIAKASANEG